MKIGVDVGALSITDDRLKLGVYWINVNLLRELARIDTRNTYNLYSFSPVDSPILRELAPSMQNIVLKPQKGWFSLRLPLEMFIHPVDVFLGLSQGIPPSHSRNIGFIYDLGFLHNPHAYPGSKKKLEELTETVIQRSNTIVTISQIVKDDLVNRYYVDPNKIVVAYPGVDEIFTPVGKMFRSKTPYFLFVGALKPGKNVPTILKTFARFLEATKKNYYLHLVGSDYWKDSQIDDVIHQLKLENKVQRHGYIADQELAQLYRGATAFVSPSLYEGFCLPAVEAMACGCPVIGSTAGAFPEVVGENGILVSPTDTDALASAMTTLANDSKARKMYSERGIQQSKRYSWEKFAKQVYEIIKSYE